MLKISSSNVKVHRSEFKRVISAYKVNIDGFFNQYTQSLKQGQMSAIKINRLIKEIG